MTVPDEAVEAAAKAIHEAGGFYKWEDPEGWRERAASEEARAALTAAAPFIAAQAWDEGRLAGWSNRTQSFIRQQTYTEDVANATPNPYRSGT